MIITDGGLSQSSPVPALPLWAFGALAAMLAAAGFRALPRARPPVA